MNCDACEGRVGEACARRAKARGGASNGFAALAMEDVDSDSEEEAVQSVAPPPSEAQDPTTAPTSKKKGRRKGKTADSKVEAAASTDDHGADVKADQTS